MDLTPTRVVPEHPGDLGQHPGPVHYINQQIKLADIIINRLYLLLFKAAAAVNRALVFPVQVPGLLLMIPT
ncbi:MAG: hypothetical protein U5N58_03205 [Actinomycetota bacterium]|nr:hypothetical protein [Actinomycetota bacterium]